MLRIILIVLVALTLTTQLEAMAHPVTTTSVAVIGSGAAGLACARQFSKILPNLTLDVFEKSEDLGGVWNYNGRQDAPMYKNLRTNLPKELMGYREFPFTKKYTNDEESYVTHNDVQTYLKNYCDNFNLRSYIKFNTKIDKVAYDANDLKASTSNPKLYPKLKVDYTNGDGTKSSKVYDHVVVANGHYARPSIPSNLQNLFSKFNKKAMHAITYDEPDVETYGEKVVICIGGRASGSDIAREISSVAKKVYVSDSASSNTSEGNVHTCARTAGLADDGFTILLEDGTSLSDVDVVVFCTGYDYAFPFLEDTNVDLSFVTGERRVGLLYKQLFHATHPTLSFIGLPHSVVPFPLFELQAEAVAQVAKDRFEGGFAGRQERLEAGKTQFESGGPGDKNRVVDTHYVGDYQWEYCREMAKLGKVYNEELEGYLLSNKGLYDTAGEERKACAAGGNDTYRRTRFSRDIGANLWDQL
ncbi:hypothetical protein TL16_g04037 [Triparma laevis f. inornata]|uniref:Flavin-containing monooxygenase n=1 Tax=Triparma laevis f. inornata TaxID=1714386 RepID=A0A9W7A8V8_9STRA|nr:hypothetical protein TL16_g04037 [Triparma laevis f. inornata]